MFRLKAILEMLQKESRKKRLAECSGNVVFITIEIQKILGCLKC